MPRKPKVTESVSFQERLDENLALAPVTLPPERPDDPLDGMKAPKPVKLTALETWRLKALEAEGRLAFAEARIASLQREVMLQKLDPQGQLRKLEDAEREAVNRAAALVKKSLSERKRLGLGDNDTIEAKE